MTERTIKIFSLCTTFREYEKEYEYICYILGPVPDIYIKWQVNLNASIDIGGLEPDDLSRSISKILILNGAKDLEEVFIHIDY